MIQFLLLYVTAFGYCFQPSVTNTYVILERTQYTQQTIELVKDARYVQRGQTYCFTTSKRFELPRTYYIQTYRVVNGYTRVLRSGPYKPIHVQWLPRVPNR